MAMRACQKEMRLEFWMPAVVLNRRQRRERRWVRSSVSSVTSGRFSRPRRFAPRWISFVCFASFVVTLSAQWHVEAMRGVLTESESRGATCGAGHAHAAIERLATAAGTLLALNHGNIRQRLHEAPPGR